MKIPQKIVENMVAEASKKMSDPNYSAVLVGGFVQSQGPAAQYISASADELGGADQVVTAIFHTALIAECFKRANNSSVGLMSYDILDRAAEGDRREKLEKKQPAILAYIEENIDNAALARTVMLFALAMDVVA